MKKDHYLAVDLGTTRLKAAIADSEGNLVEVARQPSPVHVPCQGASEMDLDEVWHCFCGVTSLLLARRPALRERIAGVGISGLGEGLWPVDERGRPVRPAILWNDNRASDLVIPGRMALDRLLQRHAVTPLFPGAAPMALRWLREWEPENYRRIRWGVHSKDWLNFQLTGRMATDFSDASTASVDVLAREYFFPLFDELGIPEMAGAMPPLLASSDVVGEVTDDAAALTGIPAGTPVIAGALDAAAISLGAGVTRVGDACTVFGTCLCNQVLISREQVDHRDSTGSFLLPAMPQGFIRMMGTTSGGRALDWTRELLAPGLSFPEVEALIARTPVGSDGLLFQPYLMGERAPFKQPRAYGSFFGLRPGHERAHLLRASYEGLIYSLKDCYSHLPPVTGRLMLAGGGAASDTLCSLTASILERPVCRSSVAELGLSGIATTLRTALGDGAWDPPLGRLEAFDPLPTHSRALLAGYDRFQALRAAVAPLWEG